MVSETHGINPTYTRAVMNQMEVGTVPQRRAGVCPPRNRTPIVLNPKGYGQLEILDNTILILEIFQV